MSETVKESDGEIVTVVVRDCKMQCELCDEGVLDRVTAVILSILILMK